MRHLAWLHATPEGSKKSRLTYFTEKEEKDGESSPFLQFPELDDAAYLVPMLREAGLMSSSGMGVVPLSWQEIESWLRCTELQVTIWEKLTIREMSEAYVAEFNKASTKDAAAPYVHIEPDQIDRVSVSAKVGSLLRGFKRKSANAIN